MRPSVLVEAVATPRFGQEEPRRHEVREAERRREPHRRLGRDAAQQAADRRAEDESQPERRAHQAHAAGAVLRRGDVGDVGLRGGNVRAGNAADDARDEQQHQRAGERERHVREAGAEQADQDDRLAADLVGPAAPDRREHELHQREARAQQPDRECGRAERLGVERQQRNDDAEAEQVDEDGNEDDDERRHYGQLFSRRPWSHSDNATYQAGNTSDSAVHGPSVAGSRKIIQVKSAAHVAPRINVGICSVFVRDG